jgi:hypothetical protein
MMQFIRMLFTPILASTQNERECNPTVHVHQKRSKLRVPLDCEISFQAGPHHSAGRLVDVSSKAVAFRTETDLPDGTFVQVSIPWPVCLENCLLKLVALGRVMNKRGEVVVVSIDLHEFRTRGTPLSLLLSWLCEVLEKPDLKYMRVPRLDCQRRPVRGSELVEPQASKPHWRRLLIQASCAPEGFLR